MTASVGPTVPCGAGGSNWRPAGRKNGKKRAVVGVARKLATLLHRLWITGAAYEPLRSAG
jgi:hypothetical protein